LRNLIRDLGPEWAGRAIEKEIANKQTKEKYDSCVGNEL
jgi:hypothetical protein